MGMSGARLVRVIGLVEAGVDLYPAATEYLVLCDASAFVARRAFVAAMLEREALLRQLGPMLPLSAKDAARRKKNRRRTQRRKARSGAVDTADV